jgi:dipeptidyl aminopeptidase/acylaminoacyl peptidase
VDRLTVPVFVAHGTGDFNVPFAASETLVNNLLAAHKTFDVVAYSRQPHHWEDADVVRDWLVRVERFLRHVQADNAALKKAR